jgi:hypothetical protein
VITRLCSVVWSPVAWPTARVNSLAFTIHGDLVTLTFFRQNWPATATWEPPRLCVVADVYCTM